MQTLKLSERLDRHFPLPKSNRGFKPSQFIQTLILMPHEPLSSWRSDNHHWLVCAEVFLLDRPLLPPGHPIMSR